MRARLAERRSQAALERRTTGRARFDRRGRKVRPALEQHLGRLGVELPVRKASDDRDAIDDLMNRRNVYAHGKGQRDRIYPDLWHLDALLVEMSAEPTKVPWHDLCQRWFDTAREHCHITGGVFEVYLQFWRRFHGKHTGREVTRRH